MQVIKPNEITNANRSYVDGSFTRASTGTYVDSDGIIKTAAINVPRFNYNPSSLQFGGLLLEPSKSNISLQSEQIDNGSWGKVSATVTPNNLVAPDGTTTGDTLTTTLTGSFLGRAGQARTVTPGWWTLSGFFKKTGTNDFISFTAEISGQGGRRFWFNLATGTLGGNALAGAGVWAFVGAIQAYPNGWYRCSLSVNINTAGGGLSYFVQNAIADVNTTSNNGDSSGWWGLQLEQSEFATSYIPTTTATVIRSADVITGSGLIYTDLTDATAVWSSGTTYAAAAVIRYLGNIYTSLAGTNLNRQPDISPTWWVKLGPDNLHATFDGSISTASQRTTSFTQVVKMGRLDSFALINVVGATIAVSATDATSGEIIYANTFGLSGDNILDWSQYFFFDPITQRTQIIDTGINSTYSEIVFTVRVVNRVGETASLGSLITGLTTVLGQTQLGVQTGIIDYSRKETDAFGTSTFVERPFSKRMTAELYLDNTQLNTVQRFLYSIRATPVVWIASLDPIYEEALVVYGFYRDFSTNIAYPDVSLCSLEIEGLT